VTTVNRESATPSPAIIGCDDVRGLTDREAINEPERPVFSKIETLRLVRALVRARVRRVHRRRGCCVSSSRPPVNNFVLARVSAAL